MRGVPDLQIQLFSDAAGFDLCDSDHANVPMWREEKALRGSQES